VCTVRVRATSIRGDGAPPGNESWKLELLHSKKFVSLHTSIPYAPIMGEERTYPFPCNTCNLPTLIDYSIPTIGG